MSDPVSTLEYQNLRNTAGESKQPSNAEAGWGATGVGLGDALTGASTAPGNPNYAKGMQQGAATINALTEAKLRIAHMDQGEQAAQVIEKTGDQIGLTPLQKGIGAAVGRSGESDRLGDFINKALESNRQQLIADPNAPLAARHAAATANAPASGASHAEGLYGNTFDPMANGGSGQVTVSPMQTAIGQSDIAKNNAEAAAATRNAATHASVAAGNKPPANMRWQIDPNTMEPILDSTGRQIAEPIPGMENKPESATGARFHSNTVLAGGNLANEVENIKHLGVTTTLGVTGTASNTPGIMNTLKQNLGNKLSDSDQQNYNTSTNQIGRFMGVQENGGRMVPASMADAITQNVASVPTNTESARLVHLGAVKQVVQASDDTLQASTASAQLKALSAKNRGRVEAAVPYEMGDALDFGHEGKPGQTFQQFLDAKKAGAAGASGHPQDIQDLLAKYGAK